MEHHSCTPIGYGAYHDVSYRITTIVHGLGIRDNHTHFNRAPRNSVETTLFELWFGKEIQISQENQAHQETLHFHPSSSVGGRHRDLQDTYGSECYKPID